MNLVEFRQACLREAESCPAHKQDYFESSLVRFFKTFILCRKLIPPQARVLSAGAGVAYIERVLAKVCQMRFCLIDFPNGVESGRDDYSRFGFEIVGQDLASEWRITPQRLFDAAFSFQVLEHLPIPPQQHFGDLIRYLKPGGLLLVSTPNLARLENIVRLTCGNGILTDAELAFRPVNASNQAIHRREYTASEIRNAMIRIGAKDIQTYYTFQHAKRNASLRRRVSRSIQWLVPWWRPQLILAAYVSGSS